MNEIMNSKIEYLDRANTTTTVLALLAAASAAPGAISLYRFMIDAQDQKIEVSTLLGIGNRSIPGLGLAIQEPYMTLTILILAVLIPLLIFLFLLTKKSGLKKGKVVGSGLYWFIILAGIIGTLLGLGLFAKILQADFSNLTSIKTDPANLFIAGISVVSAIVAVVAINLLGKAAIAPEVLVDEEDEDLDIQVIERGTGTYSPDQAAVADASAMMPELVVSAEPVSRTFASDLTDANVPMDSSAAEPGSSESAAELIPSETEPTAFVSDLSIDQEPESVPSEITEPIAEDYAIYTDEIIETAPVFAEPFAAGISQTAAAAIMERDLGISAQTSPEQSPERLDQVPDEDYAELAEPESYNYRPSGPVLIPAGKTAPASTPTVPETAEKPKDREIKRKLVSFPGDDTKVIVVLREYVHGRFVREWSEIRLKSDFTRPRGNSRY